MTACNARPPEGHPFAASLVACHLPEAHDGPHAWDIEPSPARRGIDKLLATFRHREIESINSQPEQTLVATVVGTGAEELLTVLPSGPWVLVKFVGGDEYAVWKLTGAVYRVGPDGAVDDDPILTIPT